MKALSIREPWGTLILEGKKPIETRVWKTDYRGDLLLCASQKPKSIISGFAFAVVNLYDIQPMVEKHESKAQCLVYPGAYSWFLKDIRPIKFFPVKGQLKLFNVDDKYIQYIEEKVK